MEKQWFPRYRYTSKIYSSVCIFFEVVPYTIPKSNSSFHFQAGSSDSAHIAVGGGASDVEAAAGAAAAAAATPCVAWEGTVKVSTKREKKYVRLLEGDHKFAIKRHSIKENKHEL